MDDLLKTFVEGVQFVIGRLKGKETTTVQTVLFDRSSWDSKRARSWLGGHGFKSSKLDETENKLRFRQREPSEFETGSFRTIATGKRMSQEEPEVEPYEGILILNNFDDNKQFDNELDPLDTESLHDIDGIEIFRSGTWNDDKYTTEDLEEIVQAFDKVGYRPPVKLGHEERSGDPAFGWVKSLHRVGDKLLADFIDVPKRIFDAIKNRRFDSVSSEIFWDLKRDGKTFRRALKAVALLGSEIPGVANLRPLRDVVNSIPNGDFERVIQYTVYPEVWNMDKIEDLNKQVADLTANLKEAEEAKVKAESEAKEATEGSEEAEKTAALLKEKETELAEFTEKLEAVQKELKEVSNERETEVKSLREQVEALTKAQAAMEEEKRLATVKAKVEAVTLPALRPHFAALYDVATSLPADKTVKFTQNDKEEDVSPVIVLDKIVEVFNKKFEKFFNELSAANISTSAADYDTSNPKELVHLKAKEYQKEHKDVSYADAIKEVLNADSELKSAYANS